MVSCLFTSKDISEIQFISMSNFTLSLIKPQRLFPKGIPAGQDRRILPKGQGPLCHPSGYLSSSAAAPETISEISVVIALCRA